MTNYRLLAVRYLKQNPRRSIITVIGTTITVMVLFTCLNLAYSFLLQTRNNEREQQDYEIVLYTETEEEIEAILQDSHIKSAYVGPYYDNYGRAETMYYNALYINTSNPYRMNATLTYLQNTYGVEGCFNEGLAWTYLQGSDGSITVVMILAVIMVCYIFAIFGVGIIRNSIHLSLLENIRDYGNLRCIGSSKKQLKQIVYLQGLILEVIGIFLGNILGTGLSIIVGVILQKQDIINLNVRFHFLPMLVILIIFLFDLRFIMDENVKLIMKMSPVSAIRGEYRIKTARIKLREKNVVRKLFQKLFGVDGDYAFKSVIRNPGRFWRTVGAMVFGIAAFMGIAAMAHSYIVVLKENIEEYKYYQIYVRNELDAGETIEQVEATLPSSDILAELSNMEEVTEAKCMYAAVGYLPSSDDLYQHLSEEYLATPSGAAYIDIKSRSEEADRDYLAFLQEVNCYGYDETDIARYKSALVEGTLDVSPQGVILVNKKTENIEDEDETVLEVTYTDYQVGDTITITDIAELHRRLDGPLQSLREDYYDALSELKQDEDYNEQHAEGFVQTPEVPTPKMERAYELWNDYQDAHDAFIAQCRQQLAEEGYYKTYVIEGIVDEDVNLYAGEADGDNLRLIMPLETYYDLTGTDASMPTGMMYHVEGMFPKTGPMIELRLQNDYIDSQYIEIEEKEEMGVSLLTLECDVSYYTDCIEEIKSRKNVLLCIAVIVLFLLLMSCLNIINATASNLHLRRRELAQLRVIGVSKKRLMKITMLEGIITALTADVIGIAVGSGVSYGVFLVLHILYGTDYYFPYGVAVLAVVLSVLVLCGAIYLPLKDLSNDLVKDLNTGSD